MTSRPAQPRGFAAVAAMLFLALMTTLCLGMYGVSTLGAQSARNAADVKRAQAAAETGLRWQAFRFAAMQRPKTAVGNLAQPYVRSTLWPAMKAALLADYNALPGRPAGAVAASAESLQTSPVAADADGGTFAVTVDLLPTYSTDPIDAGYRRMLRVTSVGTFGRARRSVSMDFRVDKRVNFAVVGKTRIQLGRNTVVEGPVSMATRNKFSPYLVLSDFTHFHAGLANRVRQFEAFCDAKHDGYDGRVDVRNAAEADAARAAGFDDADGDGHIDEFDLFLQQFDADGDGAVDRAEFTDPATGQLYDKNLFDAIDSLNAPRFAGDPARAGLNDGKLDVRDGYAKVRGGIGVADSATSWANWLAGQRQTLQQQVRGPVAAPEGSAGVAFEATGGQTFDLNPANFEGATENYRARSGANGGPTVRSGNVVQNATLAYGDWHGELVDERTPYGSTSYQATYRRPVFRNMVFKNCTIPKGTNALFDGCTFEGVTFVDNTRDITDSSGSPTTNSNTAMQWSQRMSSGKRFTADTVLDWNYSYGYVLGNNIRFNNCTFNGPIASPYATAYSHFANSWEFTGATKFDNRFDQTATIVAPQTNIEMGSFTNPGEAPSTLVGVVVAGNIDIRGTSVVDGSILVTGDGAGNTTLGYFGPSDGDTDPGTLPEGGYGRLNIRYNPYRTLPDGINVAVTVDADVQTYREGE